MTAPFDDRPALQIEQIHATLQLDEAALRTLIRHVVHAEEHTLGMVNVILADHDTVLTLNREHLGHDYLTDVLSFDLSDTPGRVEGEVYVDLDTAAERHDEFDTSFEEEGRRYVVHGLLHLIGYDDNTPDAQAIMRRLEDRYLAAAPGRSSQR